MCYYHKKVIEIVRQHPNKQIDTYSLQIKNYNHPDPGFSLGRNETVNEVTLRHAEYLLIIEF